MTLTAFLHGYPPFWSMGGELSTHRTLRAVPGAQVFTNTVSEYELDGVQVRPYRGAAGPNIMQDAKEGGASILYAHSSMSAQTVSAARKLRIPSILAVHAPPRFANDLRQAWHAATLRLYNTETARRDWRDQRRGLVLHPPVGRPFIRAVHPSPGDALTLTSSLRNKGANRVLKLAERMPDRRFIVVESPAHETHGDPNFWEMAGRLDNVEVWPRLHPDEMWRLWAQTRILLVPSRYETYGMSALEAAWAYIPSVHVDTAHVREGIGTAARLLRSSTVDELEEAVVEVERDYPVWSDRAFDRVSSLVSREISELARFAAAVAGLHPV